MKDRLQVTGDRLQVTGGRLQVAALLLAVTLNLLPACCLAQVQQPGVQQSGSVTAGDCVKWINPGYIGDAGAACGSGGGGLSPIAAYSILSNNTGSTATPAANQSILLGTPGYTDTGILGQLTGGSNSYEQFIIQNTTAGTNASADFIVGNDLNSANSYFGDFGINSSLFSGSGSLNLPDATYLFAQNGDLALGTYTSNAIHFLVDNGVTDAMTIGTGSQVTIPTSGAASIPAFTLSGNPYSGTATTSVPLLYLNSGSTAPTSWSASGSMIGINAPSGFAGNLLDFHVNGGASLFSVNSGGTVSAAGNITTPVVVTGGYLVASNVNSNIFIPAYSSLTNETTSALQFAGSSNTGIRASVLGQSASTLTANSNYAGFEVAQTTVTTPATGTDAWLANAVINTLGTVTSGGAAITNTASLYVGSASSAGTNNYGIYDAGNIAAIGGYIGSTTGTAPTSSYIGYNLSSTVLVGSAVNIPNNTPTNITSINVPAGDWTISGTAIFQVAASSGAQNFISAAGTSSATLPTAPAGGYWATSGQQGALGYQFNPVMPYPVSFSSPTTVYLIGEATVTSGTLSGYGVIYATRRD